jgi:hypothetical protein
VIESFIAELLCGGLIWLLISAGKEASKGVSESLADNPTERREIEDARRLRKSLTPAQRRLQQMQNCSIESCNALTYLDSNYCLKHKPSMLEEIASEPEPEPDPQAEANWWEDEN